jgi:putative ABC transport system permease protein
MEPLVLRNRPAEFGYVTLKMAGNTPQQTVAALAQVWKQVNPLTKFNYEFMDQQLLTTHSLPHNAARMLGLLTLLTVLISCLGLLGMATFTAETRQKEISIRNVLGASVWQIVVLLSKGFAGLIALAVLIATPVAYFVNSLWLNFFASRVSISPLVLLAGVGALVGISAAVILSQSWWAARANPIKNLRSD